jgi:hypothetical protein
MLAMAATIALTLGGGTPAFAYQPVVQNLYTPTNTGACNKFPCVLYPKSAQLNSGRIVAAFEDDEGAVVGQTMPIYKSDDNGNTWQKLTNLKAPAYLTSNSAYANYTSAWTNPYLYVLPQAIGSMAAGTLLLASVVSGSDSAPNPNGNGNRQNVAIVLHSSTDQGVTWTPRGIIVTGPNQAQDPVWEPYLMVYNNQLVAYFSDENEADFGSTSEGGQILAHKTSSDGVTWSSEVQDVGTSYYSGRPGMTNMVQTSDGKWLMTFEYWGGGANTRMKVCGTPISCNPSDLGSAAPGSGGSPVTIRMPDGRLVFNSAGSSDVWVNTSGSSTGTWAEQKTAISSGYSRTLQYVAGTKRLAVLQANWGSCCTTGPVRYAELDVGNSAGAYYKLINRNSGQALGVSGGSLSDGASVIQWADNGAVDQQWHLWTLNNGNKLIGGDKQSGRVLGIYQASTADGAHAVQWVETQANDQQWQLVATGSYYKVVNVNSGKVLGVLGGSTTQGAQVVQWTDTGALDQQWQLVQTSS